MHSGRLRTTATKELTEDNSENIIFHRFIEKNSRNLAFGAVVQFLENAQSPPSAFNLVAALLLMIS